MRLSELFGREVRDADDVAIGRVHDVRLVQDGPLLEGFGAALRVDGLIVGRGHRGGLAVRLGYHRRRATGPYVLDRLALAFERGAHFAPWADVADLTDDGVVRLSRPVADLRPLRHSDPSP